MNPNEEKKKKAEVLDFKWQIPMCCREGHPDCPHIPKKQKKIKRNVGL